MRVIDADALTEDCKRYLCTLNPNRDGKECTRIHWLIGVLGNAPTIEPEPHWIKCSERYPEQDERVLVTIGNNDYFVWDCMSNCGDDYFWEDEHGFYHNKYEVLAWMPLPEPYREGE